MLARAHTYLVCCCALSVLSIAPVAQAGEIGLSWDASPNATGYKVFYGPNSRSVTDYSSWVDVGNVTSTTINTGLVDCQDNYFAVKAYNSMGESGYSLEISSWPRPAISGTTLPSAKQGAQSTPVRVQGINFQSGADLQVVDAGQPVPNVFVENVSATCNEVQAVVTIQPLSSGQRAAEIGTYALSVNNPNGWERNIPFQVLIEPSRFDINADDPVTQGWIDGRDVIRFVSRGLSQEGDPLYHPDFDFDGNGFVDGEDLVYLADIDHFGSCWRNSGWTKAGCPTRLE